MLLTSNLATFDRCISESVLFNLKKNQNCRKKKENDERFSIFQFRELIFPEPTLIYSTFDSICQPLTSSGTQQRYGVMNRTSGGCLHRVTGNDTVR